MPWQIEAIALRCRYETRLRRIPIALHQRHTESALMDRSLGERMGVLSALRQCEDVAISELQPTRRFPLRVVQRGIRTQEPEEQVRREGRRWRLQDQMRATGGQQQSQPAADELRHQI